MAPAPGPEIDDLLARLGLADKADAWPMHISAGQRQRLALARSLLAETPLLFLDEPTNKLDLEGVRSVRQMIAELNREHGVTIVLTTHVMEEAEELCGEIALLREGQLVAHQLTGELTRSLGLARPITVTLRQGTPIARWLGGGDRGIARRHRPRRGADARSHRSHHWPRAPARVSGAAFVHARAARLGTRPPTGACQHAGRAGDAHRCLYSTGGSTGRDCTRQEVRVCGST